jgi:flagellar biosynthesis/type III secretory pathway protein FliH
VKISQQVLEWQAEARAEGRAEGRTEGQAEALLQLVEFRFPGSISSELAAEIRALRDVEQLKKGIAAAVAANSLDEFRSHFRNGA